MDGKLVVVTISPGSYDTIYVGFAERHGDMFCLTRASMVLRYKEVGVPGIATEPDKAVRLRPSVRPVWIPLRSVSAIVEADPEAWEAHLGVSRG